MKFLLHVCFLSPAAIVVAMVPVYGQTCCTGGAPLTGVLNIQALPTSGWGISLTYDNNLIEDFIQGTEQVDGGNISRFTKTLLAQIDYGISENITGTVLIPYLWLGQTTETFSGEIEGKTSGLGDILLMSQYKKALPKQAILIVGLGIKIPSGATQNKDMESGLILPATLQPGTGSVDFLVFSQYQTSFSFRKSLSFTQTFSARVNTVSKEFAFHNTYRFGHVFQAFTAFADQFLIAGVLQNPSLTFRYRYAGNDIQEGFPNVNTGGHWLYLTPGWAINVSQNLLVGIAGEFPLYRNLNGLQITTSRKLMATLQFLIPVKNVLDL